MKRTVFTVLGVCATVGAGVLAMAQQADSPPARAANLASSTAGYFSGYWGLKVFGIGYGAYFEDADAADDGWAKLAFGDTGIEASGSTAGGIFDSDVGYGVYAISASGVGGQFTGIQGVKAYGVDYGGYFQDANTADAWAKLGFLHTGIEAQGNTVGGNFSSSGGNGIEATASSGIGGKFTGYWGLEAYGAIHGGYFEDSNPADDGWAKLAFGDTGIQASGSTAGGKFDSIAGYAVDATASSAVAGHFTGYQGLQVYGTDYAGYFEDSGASDDGWAKLAFGDTGIEASGSTAGGKFDSLAGHGVEATAGSGIAGYFSGYWGLEAYGTLYAGYFQDSETSDAWAKLGFGHTGISAQGNTVGGTFYSSGGNAVEATAASGIAGKFTGFQGVLAYGSQYQYAVRGENSSTGTYSELGKDTYKIYGTGTVSFVQNHPYAPDRVIVYSAPEGDEVATYTRGTAQLVDGEARVRLGETFAWVTNPDLGLTVHLTPRDSWADLYVAERSTSEIVVRSAAGDPDAAFDYLVYGLRIGFEGVAVVRERREDAPIPAMVNHTEELQRKPDLVRYTALDRHLHAEAASRGVTAQEIDLSGAAALTAAIGVHEPGVPAAHQPARRRASAGSDAIPAGPPGTSAHPAAPSSGADSERSAGFGGGWSRAASDRTLRTSAGELAFVVETSDDVEPGDVLVADEGGNAMRRSFLEADPAVVGVVAATPGVILGDDGSTAAPGPRRAELAVAGIVRCRVDATYGPIRVGDMLVTSTNPGHAMAAAAPVGGTVVGKALEPLAGGTGTIRVLVMLR